MDNIRTTLPKIGDAVVGNLTTGKVEFITSESFVNNLGANYELIGVVYKRKGKKVKIAYKSNADKTWLERYEYILTGYTLDSTVRTGVLSIRDNSSASENTDYTINYNCATKAELVETLNAFFASTTAFTEQDWFARVEGDNIIIGYAFTFSGQYSYDTAKDGFGLTKSTLEEVPSSTNMLRANGGRSGEGALSSYERALVYFTADNSSTSYNPATDVTSIKTTYPVCLPAYLGTSQYQADHCALLRQTYGEGEEGWKKYMKAQMAVFPCDYGVMIDDEKVGLERTKYLATKTYNSQVKTNEPYSKAAKYCYDTATQCIPQGRWYLPTTADIAELLETIKYPTPTSSRDADAINKTLYAMGGTAIGNSSSWWSCVRYGSVHAWNASGLGGFFRGNLFSSGYQALPVSLFILP